MLKKKHYFIKEYCTELKEYPPNKLVIVMDSYKQNINLINIYKNSILSQYCSELNEYHTIKTNYLFTFEIFKQVLFYKYIAVK